MGSKSKNHTGFIIAATVATVAAAGIAYLYLTEEGEAIRDDLTYKLKEGVKELASGMISKATNISRETIKKVADLVIK